MDSQMNIKFEDVVELFEKIEEIHPNMFFNITKVKFAKEVNKIRENWENLDFYDKYYEIMRLNALIGDAHTNISLDFDGKKIFPYTLTKCKEGVFISSLDKNLIDKKYMFSKVLAINNIPIDEIIDMGKKIVPSENLDAHDARIIKHLNELNFLKILKITDEEELSMSVFQDEKVKTIKIPVLKNNIRRKYVKKSTNNFNYRDSDYYFYIDINRFKENGIEDKVLLDQIHEKAEQAVLDGKPIILDVRDNAGGTTDLFLPLFEIFKDHGATGFCLINNISASASVVSASVCKDAGFCLVGESMSQSSTFYSNAKCITTTNGLSCNVSTNLRYENCDREKASSRFIPRGVDLYQDAIKPDVYIEKSIEELKKGEDVALKYCEKECMKMGIQKREKFVETEFVR